MSYVKDIRWVTNARITPATLHQQGETEMTQHNAQYLDFLRERYRIKQEARDIRRAAMAGRIAASQEAFDHRYGARRGYETRAPYPEEIDDKFQADWDAA